MARDGSLTLAAGGAALRMLPPSARQFRQGRRIEVDKTPGKQGPGKASSDPNKIGTSTPYDFHGKNLTPCGGLLPVVTMLEKLGFQSLVEQTVTSKRIPGAMDLYRFVLEIVLGLYIGFPRLNQLRFIARDPILTGVLQITKLAVQSTFWRFVKAIHLNVARQRSPSRDREGALPDLTARRLLCRP